MSNKPVALKFPTMLRKMWSGGEVQAWLDELPLLYTHPVKELIEMQKMLGKQKNEIEELKEKLHNAIIASGKKIWELKDEVEALKRGNEAIAKLNYQKGYEAGSSLTTYNKPAMEKLQVEIDELIHDVGELVKINNELANEVINPKQVTNEDLKRAVQMLEIASEYIRKTDPYGEMFYDDASCDGGCIADYCESIAESLRKAGA